MGISSKSKPIRRIDLKAGTVFRYLSETSPFQDNNGKDVYYVEPKHSLMPALLRGEKPQPSKNSKDQFFVEVLWDPEKATKRWGEVDEDY